MASMLHVIESVLCAWYCRHIWQTQNNPFDANMCYLTIDNQFTHINGTTTGLGGRQDLTLVTGGQEAQLFESGSVGPFSSM
jgi:hypothetical protein